MSGDGATDPIADLDHSELRSALEFAVLMAAEGAKRRPPMSYPSALKPLLGERRLSRTQLGRVRRAIEGDQAFRSALAAGALPELVDEPGRLWLAQPDGWVTQLTELIAARRADAEEQNLRRELARAEKRRLGAEHSAVRAQAEIAELRARLATLEEHGAARAREHEAALSELADLRDELRQARLDLRHARDRERAALDRAAKTPPTAAPDNATASSDAANTATDPAADESVAGDPVAAEALGDLRRIVGDVVGPLLAIARRLDAATEGSETGEVTADRPMRTPVRLRGGVGSRSPAAAAQLLRAGAAVYIDGYNVTKRVWPDCDLQRQRELLRTATENLLHRYQTDATVVFDGADVEGAHADRGRRLRSMYSPAGVSADDVIRTEVAGISPDRAVVVVTSDLEVARDVRAMGANVVPADALAALF